MPTDRFLVAPFDENSGTQRDVRPWLIPDQAFEELTNAYVFRGRVRKRFGSEWLGNTQLSSRFRVQLPGTTDGAGNYNNFVPLSGGVPIVTPAIGQLFSIGTEVFTVDVLGNPANMLISGAATLATYDTTTGQVIINGAAANTLVYFYPALPAMGLLTFEQSDINNEFLIGFDTRFAYQYLTGAGWERLANELTPGASRWTGNDSEFFWGSTWTGTNAFDRVFFVTNFNETEPNFMRTFFGATSQWDNFRPKVSNLVIGPPLVLDIFLDSARIIVPFKNRLVALNTYESESSNGVAYTQRNYPNRARYSQVGSPLDVNAWRQDIPGRGSGIDCPTTEQIVTVEFIKDRLIVFFERSTWELVYTGNQAYPFAWQQINTELGAESTFSVVPFDKIALGVGNVGIHACNGSNVERIDNRIPDTVFDIHNDNEGVFRVYGIRDYFVEMVYWSFPSTDSNTTFPFPNRVLIYNYKNGTWGFNEDSITVFGYYQQQVGITWDSSTVTWDDNVTWDSGPLQGKFRHVIAGNQEGYTFIISPDTTTNASVLQITQIAVANNVVTITAINHNIRLGEFVKLENIVGTGNLNLLNNKIFKVIGVPVPTADTFSFVYADSVGSIIAGNYLGNGVIARVSNIKIKTKEFNFYAKQGRNASVSRVDFMVDRTDLGQIQVDFLVSTAQTLLVGASGPLGTNSILGTSTIDTFPYTAINNPQDPLPYEANANRLWRPIYLSADGEVVQLFLRLSDEQMTSLITNADGSISGPALVDFQLHAFCIYARPTSYGFQ